MKKELILILYFLIPFLIIRFYGFEYLKFSKKNKSRLSLSISKIIKNLHYITFLLCLLLMLIDVKYNYIVNLIWIKRFLIIITLLSGILMNSIINKISINKVENRYFVIFSYLPIIISIIWSIPFWGLFTCYSIYSTLFNPIEKIHYEDNNLKIQSSYFNPMAPAKIEMYRKGLFFNKTIKMKEDRIYDIDSIKVQYKNDKTKILFYNNENLENPIIEEFKN